MASQDCLSSTHFHSPRQNESLKVQISLGTFLWILTSCSISFHAIAWIQNPLPPLWTLVSSVPAPSRTSRRSNYTRQFQVAPGLLRLLLRLECFPSPVFSSTDNPSPHNPTLGCTLSLTAQLPCSHLSDHRSPYFLWKISSSTLHYVVNEGLTLGKAPGIGPDWFKLTGISGLLDTIIGSWMGTWRYKLFPQLMGL